MVWQVHRWQITGLAALCLAALALPRPAAAGLEICNDTAAVQTLALGYKGTAGWTSEGWWTLAADSCAQVVTSPLSQRFYYLRVETEGWHFHDDKLSFCVSDGGAFTIDGDASCAPRGFRQEDFARIDTGPKAQHHVHALSTNLTPTATEPAVRAGSQPQVLGPAVYQTCRDPGAPHVSFCTFIGAGRRFLVYDDGRTPARLWQQLHSLPQGRRFTLTGYREDLYDTTSELVLHDLMMEPLGRPDRLLDLLQGQWQSADDPDDRFSVQGAERVNSYAGADTTVEYLSIRSSCAFSPGRRSRSLDPAGQLTANQGEGKGTDKEARLGQGPYLSTWDNAGGTGLCYRILRISEQDLALVYLGTGSTLTYRRVD